ncbi:serine protease [Microbacterium sp. ARD31]|uniref:trypsin-like serine peptidase n=1 Tax=Microbacterium sp. ARD31 TaxID=2962576 RepID=UPI00288252E4|nr:serine protease [Microbacterium sp. ARD31]MDT0181505.1 serine protease [Microbacterium sp. ARD31]
MQLGRNEVERVLSAMESHFDPFAMDRLLETRFGLPIANVTSVMKNFSQQSVDVLRYFDQRNRVEELILALRDARPDVNIFVEILDEAGFVQMPPGDLLEVLVRTGRGSFKDVASFRSEVARIEAAVCRIETPRSFGTGFLVGSRYVLTNHHVVADCVDGDGAPIASIECQFDFKVGPEQYATPMVTVAIDRVLAWSPCPVMHADMTIDSGPKALDYALLQIADGFAGRAVVDGGNPRGSIRLAPIERVLRPHDGLLVVQHPRAQPMKIDIGSVLSVGAARVRHSVNTEGGSSGAPVFDANLTLVALHHAGFDGPGGTMPFNQAIRIDAILEDLGAKSIRIGGD